MMRRERKVRYETKGKTHMIMATFSKNVLLLECEKISVSRLLLSTNGEKVRSTHLGRIKAGRERNSSQKNMLAALFLQSVVVTSLYQSQCNKIVQEARKCNFSCFVFSIQILHQNGKFPEGMSQLALHGLSLQDEGSNLDQVLIALHTFVVSTRRKKIFREHLNLANQ